MVSFSSLEVKEIEAYQFSQVWTDFVAQFGNEHDGTIQIPVTTQKGIVEASYFYGYNKKKNIVVISSQVGCPERCTFCELGEEEFKGNLSAEEIYEQVILILQKAAQYGIDIGAYEHKVTIANTGEPFFNENLVEGLERIARLGTSFKVSTIFPAGQKARKNLEYLAQFAARYGQPVQLQVSLISTSEEYRLNTAGTRLASFAEIRSAAEYWKNINPQGRKLNLSLILSGQTPCDVDDVYEIFPPELFRFRFRPYVPTENGKLNLLSEIDEERMKKIKDSFAEKGYEVDDWATPTPIEQKFGLVGNVTRRLYLQMMQGRG